MIGISRTVKDVNLVPIRISILVANLATNIEDLQLFTLK